MEDLVRESAADSRSRKARRGSFGLPTAGLVAILTLSGSVAIMAQPAPQAVEAKAPAHLPAARQVLARFVKEIGGSTAFEDGRRGRKLPAAAARLLCGTDQTQVGRIERGHAATGLGLDPVGPRRDSWGCACRV